MRIHDDGQGFDSQQKISAGHFGLEMMRERAETVGASLSVTTQPGQGTELIMRWTKNL
jgi:signal transduction histidine kinase